MKKQIQLRKQMLGKMHVEGLLQLLITKNLHIGCNLLLQHLLQVQSVRDFSILLCWFGF